MSGSLCYRAKCPARSRFVRHLIPGLAFQLAPGSALEDAAPLFEEKRDVRLPALVSNVAHPGRGHRPGVWTRLATDDHPVDIPQVKVTKGSQKWFERQELDLRVRVSQVVDPVLESNVLRSRSERFVRT